MPDWLASVLTPPTAKRSSILSFVPSPEECGLAPVPRSPHRGCMRGGESASILRARRALGDSGTAGISRFVSAL